MSELKQKEKKKRRLHDINNYKVIWTHEKDNTVSLDDILCSQEYKEIIRNLLLKYK